MGILARKGRRRLKTQEMRKKDKIILIIIGIIFLLILGVMGKTDYQNALDEEQDTQQIYKELRELKQ